MPGSRAAPEHRESRREAEGWFSGPGASDGSQGHDGTTPQGGLRGFSVDGPRGRAFAAFGPRTGALSVVGSRVSHITASW